MESSAQPKHVALLLVVLLGVAAGLRLWGIGFGLPYDLTADEPHHILQALRLGADESGPLVRMWHTVGKAGLDYLLFFEYGVLYLVWRATGYVSSPDEFAIQYLEDPTAFYLLGRLTIALLGTATCFLVFWVGRRTFDARVGLGALFLAATSFFHGATSHVINVHVAMAFALWAGIAAYLTYESEGRFRWLLLAGLLLGVSVALAYTAAIGVLFVLLAVATSPGRSESQSSGRRKLGELGAVAATMLVSVALLSPDLIVGAGALLSNFSQLMGSPSGASPEGPEIREAIDSVTILREQSWMGYVDVLANRYNLLLSATAVLGMVIGAVARRRFAILLAVASVFFLVVVSASDRAPAERYLLPILPALWLLSSYAVVTLAGSRRYVAPAALVGVAAVSLYTLVGQNFLWTLPDTRVLTKSWIEANVAADSRILVDGMRFRFVQGPPLLPNEDAVARRAHEMASSELDASSKMMGLHAEAMRRASGPKYDLHSTVYGLEVKDLDHYVDECFDYVVTSSLNRMRYASAENRARHPESARFYDQIQSDPRFHAVYSIGPERWKRGGPTLTVYRVRNSCSR